MHRHKTILEKISAMLDYISISFGYACSFLCYCFRFKKLHETYSVLDIESANLSGKVFVLHVLVKKCKFRSAPLISSLIITHVDKTTYPLGRYSKSSLNAYINQKVHVVFLKLT